MASEETIIPEEKSAKTTTAKDNPRINIYVLKERFEINYETPLPQFNTNGGTAFLAIDKINPQRKLFALICNNQYPPRLSILPIIKSIESPYLLNLVDYDIVDYIPENTRNIALIYAQPQGPRADNFNENGEKLSPETFQTMLSSLSAATEKLRAANITHRAIRPDNIFYKDDSRTELVLGDCAASFPALYQPIEYETIESAMCLPAGRGMGNNANDIYSIGVTLLSLYLQKNISLEGSDEEIINRKLKKGSYATLSEGCKIAPKVTAVLKGLLDDNTETRWNFGQIYKYLERHDTGFTSSVEVEQASRAIVINGEKIYTRKGVALNFLKNPDTALPLIKSGKFAEWVKNGFDNEKLYEKVEKQLNQIHEDYSNFNTILSSLCILLDSSLPIKSGKFYVFPDGLPKLIFYYSQNGKNLNDLYDLFNSDLIKFWYQEQNNLRVPSNFSEFKNYLNNKNFGYGIYRIMYDFDEDIPCTSPLIGKDFVNTPSRLLRSLNKNYTNAKESAPYDRNIIAYLRCKMGKKIDGILTDLNSNQEVLQSSAILRLYANIQNKNGPSSLTNLTLWMINIVKPIIKSYHNIKYQKYLEHEMVKISRTGRIIDLYNMLENEETRQKDNQDYAKAFKEAGALTLERNHLLNDQKKLEEDYRDLALRATSLISILVMIAAFASNLIKWIIQ